jgi:hypothetical protein
MNSMAARYRTEKDKNGTEIDRLSHQTYSTHPLRKLTAPEFLSLSAITFFS